MPHKDLASVSKHAELTTELKPHQSKILDKLKTQRGLVAVRGMGSGKSLIGLSAIEQTNLPATAIAPASLRENLPKEQAKHFNKPFKVQHDTIQNIARKGTLKENPFLLIDEAHNLRNSSSKATSTIKKLSPAAEKVLLMTGTPFYNSVSDLSPLVNIAAGSDVLAEGQDFKNKYVTEKQVKPSFLQRLKGINPGTKEILNPNEAQTLKAIYNKWVDYEAPSNEGFPDITEQSIEVPMSERQLAIYDTIAGNLPPWVAEKVKSGLLPNRQESANLNAYLSGLRQTSLGTQGYAKENPENPKVQRAFEEFKKVLATNPQAKAIIYSNFVNSGLNPYKSLLEKENIPFGEFSGNISDKTRNQAVVDYNEGKLRALLLSPSAGEGLDLKNTTLAQILDPAWNESKINQAQARAIRYKSHDSLPPEQRKVLIQKFLATRPETLANKMGLTKRKGAVDEYLVNISKQKSELARQFEELLKNETPATQSLTEKVAKIEDDVNKFLKTPDYKFLLTKLPSNKFSTVLASKVEDANLKNFISNNHKHLSALRKNKGVTQVESQTDKTKKYSVIKHKGGTYTCDCKDYIYKQAPINSECKHIKSLEKTAAAYVSHHQQSNQRNCSAACMKMVCDYYGISKTEDECAKLIGVHKCGAENYEVADAINKVGLQTINKELSPEEVKKYLDKGYPIIMDAKSYNYKNKFHYTVLSDLDVEKDVAIIFDPNYDKKIRTLTLKELDDVWHSNEMYRPNKPLVRQGIVVFTRQH